MKIRLTIIAFYFFSFASAQDFKIIEVSKNTKTVLVFPSNIIESTIGNSLTFIQSGSNANSKYSQRILKLSYNMAAKETSDMTNLDIITEDGNSYLFMLKYVKKPSKLRWNVDVSEAIFNFENKSFVEINKASEDEILDSISPSLSNNHKYSTKVEYSNNDTLYVKEQIIKKTRMDSLYKYDKAEYYKRRCSYSNNDPSNIKRYYIKDDKLFLWLKSVRYDNGQLFINMKIENNHSIDLEIDFMDYFISTDYNKKSTNQETKLKPVHKFLEPTLVKGNTTSHFTIVFKKFVLEKNMIFKTLLKEKNGARILELNVERDIINNPQIF